MGERQEAPGELERLRAFVNTADLEAEREQLTDPEALRTWLIAAGLADADIRVRRADLGRALAVREALRALLLTHNGEPLSVPDAGETLEVAAARAQVRLHFDADAQPELRPDAGGVDGAIGRLLLIVQAAIADGTWPRLKACRNHSCEWAFYDATRNRSRTWCNMQVCGNREKARSFRKRAAVQAGGRRHTDAPHGHTDAPRGHTDAPRAHTDAPRGHTDAPS